MFIVCWLTIFNHEMWHEAVNGSANGIMLSETNCYFWIFIVHNSSVLYAECACTIEMYYCDMYYCSLETNEIIVIGGFRGACPAHAPQGSRFFRFDIQNLENVTASGVHAPLRGPRSLREILDPPLIVLSSLSPYL